ncbi:2-oxoisovalerate dehydrogenase subunit alpha [Venturia nashicola]|nr:2-oxoisovalerate dehydrogenase subunit alpha [Venturia nashicola]
MAPVKLSNRRTRRYFDIPQTSQRGKSALTTKSLWVKTAATQPAKQTLLPHKDGPTTFLSLPRELRQKILYMSYSLEVQVLKIPSGSILEDNHNNANYICETYRCDLWRKSVGNMHPEVQADFEFVYKKWMREIDGLFEQCKDKEKMLDLSYKGRYELEYPHIGQPILGRVWSTN